MIEPLRVAGNSAAWQSLEVGPQTGQQARDRALLWRATTLAIESAFRFGKDLPVGAVAAVNNTVVGRHFASDRRFGYKHMHAEYMTIADARMTQLKDAGAPTPDTVVVSVEPCNDCQDFLATVPSIKRVGFGLPRTAVEDKGLIKRHDESIFGRALRLGLPYEVVQIDDPLLHEVGNIILDNTHRDPHSEVVEIDRLGLQRALTEFNGRSASQ